MLNAQLEETGGAPERELGAVVAATLPRSAFVRTFRTKSGGYDVEADWQTSSPYGLTANCSLVLHFTGAEISTYTRFNEGEREEACRRVADWLSIRLELQAGDMLWDKGFDIDAVAPSAFFVGESGHTNTLQ
ncbi:hypothetical protein [Ralstonia sp.]|uniref:hypothetical protein n=1 Tax=Ralstonia sp. TaxID=54061 RepID=UPI0005EB626D|nr:hypothetical protein [Ralstonia sp.]HWV04018.1 hypothetical protein [Ralstonia sp.]